jgi:hypothetical protein
MEPVGGLGGEQGGKVVEGAPFRNREKPLNIVVSGFEGSVTHTPDIANQAAAMIGGLS